MNQESEFLHQVEEWVNDSMEISDRAAFEQKLESDPLLKQKAIEHAAFIGKVKAFGSREKLKASLDNFHTEVDQAGMSKTSETKSYRSRSIFSSYISMAAIAASVAVVSSITVWWFAANHRYTPAANYVEIARKVEQIKRSQNLILADLAEAKAKVAPAPGKYAGTGFLLAGNGYAVTSYHVVKEADSVIIENEKMGRLRTTVVYNDVANDISILRIESVGFKTINVLPYLISSAEASLGEDTFTLGFPREDIVFGEGSVSAASGYNQNPNSYQISIPVNPGNSGGPLLNTRGDLIGIVSGIQTETTGAAFAIKSSFLLKALTDMPTDSLHAAPTQTRVNTLKKLSRVEQVKRWKELVFMVRVYK